ncbi:calcium-binding protein, partial [Pararhizobium sp. LjRoot255]|uniref:calcium-binding protein n=1 Tax=Pararhizobium sp. LjRoot255 TaxID=3342298 RepID=UPI003F4F41AF
GSILIKATLDSSYDRGIDKIVFADGTTWTRADLRLMLLDQASTVGNDIIAGFNVAETITGGLGNDVINGAAGDDTYVYARGEGNDTITEESNNGANDRLLLADVNPADVTLVRNGNDLTVVIAESSPGAGDAGSILIKATLDSSYDRGIDKIVFADGTTWTRAQLRDMLLTSTAANETLNGFSGDDTFRYARGDGNDTIIEEANNGVNDRLLLTDVNPADVTLVRNGNDLTVVIAESSPGAGDAGSILIKATLDSSYDRGIDKIVFADGTTWTRADLRLMLLDQASTVGNDIIAGFNVAETITGGLGNDVINGAAGDDTYVYARGEGNDTITEESNNGANDRLLLADVNPADVTLVRNGNDLTVVIAESSPGAGDAGSILIKATLDSSYDRGIDKIVFADGTTWIRAQMLTHIAYVGGTSGNDTIMGASGADEIRAGIGNDTLSGLSGSDTYVYSLGDGNDVIDEAATGTDRDVLRLVGLNQADVVFERPAADLTDIVLRIKATGSTIILDNQFDQEDGVEKIIFDDGTVLGGDDWSLDGALIGLAGISGTSGNDTISGTAANDIFNAGLGDDRFNSGPGSDTYIYRFGDGSDYINDESGSVVDVDVLRFSDLNASDLTISRSGNHMKILVNSTGHVITLDEQFYSATANWGMEKFEFADGTNWNLAQINKAGWYRGTSGNDTITGSTWDDTILGLAGNDTLAGGAGNDLFIFQSGFGKDTINDFTVGAGFADVIRLDSNIFADFASVYDAASQVGANTVITFDANNTITLKNIVKTDLHADDFSFMVA